MGVVLNLLEYFGEECKDVTNLSAGWRKAREYSREIDISLVAGGKLCYTEKKRHGGPGGVS